MEASFPEAFFVLVATRLNPLSIVFGVVLNFENYDVQPLSVRFVNPLTRNPLSLNEIYCLPTLVSGPNPLSFQIQPLVQGFSQDRPFLCLQGIREYHDNEGHSGDSWFLYRKTGSGTLLQILEVIMKYGPDSIQAYHLQVNPQIGFSMNPSPL